MFKWESVEEKEDLPALPPAGQPRRPTRRGWLLLLGSLVLLGVVGLAVLRWRLGERRQAVRQDVAAFVEREERARLFGERDLAADLVAPGVPRNWYSAYRDTFVSSEPARPLDLAIEDVTFDGAGALVTLRLDRHPQARYYRFAGRDWGRAPVPDAAWGDGQETVQLPNGTTVIFRPRDGAFARAVARDLPALFDELGRWPGEPHVERIEFEPVEFHEPLIRAEGAQIVLNSPLLVPFDKELDGEAAVRLALAELLFQRAGPTALTLSPLPGSDGFVAAAKTVAAMHWALLPEVYAHRADRWRARLGGQWTSPFFPLQITDRGEAVAPSNPEQAAVAALLMADFIDRTGGPQALAAVVRQLLSPAESWDQVFRGALGRPTITLEGQVAAAAGLGGGPAPEAARQLGHLPLEAKFLRLDSPNGRQLYVKGLPADHPVLVELPADATGSTQDGVPLRCISPHSTLQIEGTWLDVGYRLKAGRLIVRDLALPIALGTPPPDTLAYLIERYVETSQSRATLIALRADGTTAPVAELASAAYSAAPSFVSSGESLSIVFRLELLNCDRPLLIRYDPGDGRISKWLAPPARGLPGTSWPVQRAGQQDLLLFQASNQRGRSGPAGERAWQYSVLQRGSPLVVQPLGELESSLQPWGWSAATGRIVAFHFDGALRVGLVDLASRDATWFDLPEGQVGIPSRPSVDGRWLAYLTHSPGRSTTFDTLRVLNLVSGEDVVLLQVGADEGLFWATWSANPADDRLLVPAGHIVNGELEVTRLLTVRPDQPGGSTVAAEIAAGERLFGDPVLCPDDRILYTVEKDGSFLTRLHPAGAPPITLLQANHPLRPLACPGSIRR
ncbi:MAG: hypothetical protein M5U01_27980 [Ardenticatenaceae bacterium]|nr:hypothetical protein [Ardenticatenaceae bacterium]